MIAPQSAPALPVWQGWTIIAPLVVVAGVTFNFGLAIVNAQVMPLTQNHVVLSEAVIVCLAHVVILRTYDRRVTPWYLMMVLLLILGVARWCFTGVIDPKSLRDWLLIPTFVALGIVAGPRHVGRMLLALQVTVLVVVLFEILAVQSFSDLSDIRGFYINTRDFSAEAFWNNETSLFISATRPGERNLFPFLNIHRASSLFLEPVSLGNYCIIIVAWVSARYREMSRTLIAFYLVSTLVLLVACDGRLSIIVSCGIIFLAAFRPIIPRASALYLPAIIVMSFVIAAVLGEDAKGDNLAGRTAFASFMMMRFGWLEYLGISNAPWAQNHDSGITYLIVTQSIFGTVAIWLFIVFATTESTRTQAVFKRSTMVFLVTTMLISNSYLSIKTAALVWFLIGTEQVRRESDRRDSLKAVRSTSISVPPPLSGSPLPGM